MVKKKPKFWWIQWCVILIKLRNSPVNFCKEIIRKNIYNDDVLILSKLIIPLSLQS